MNSLVHIKHHDISILEENIHLSGERYLISKVIVVSWMLEDTAGEVPFITDTLQFTNVFGETKEGSPLQNSASLE